MIISACSSTAGGCSQAGQPPSPPPAWLQRPPRSSLKADSSGVAPAFAASGTVGGCVVTATDGGGRVSCACGCRPGP